jgi:cyanophycin synthetase
VTLHAVANIGAGGESVDVTALVHPDSEDIAVRAAKTLPGALHAGLDLLAEDVSAPPAGQEWAVCEINSRPGLAMHHFPVSGRPRDAAGALIEHLFPGSRICGPFEYRSVRTVISGQVTGVGFRQWIWRRAHRRGLTGLVRNLEAGQVEAIFSGAPHAVEDMVETCRAGPRKAVVTDVSVEPWGEMTSADFQIRG